jgi:hypothetical protein
MFQQFIGPRRCLDPSIVNAQEEVTRDLLGRMLADPENFSAHIREYVLSRCSGQRKYLMYRF